MLFAAMHIHKITHLQLLDLTCTNIYISKNINLIFIFFNKYKLILFVYHLSLFSHGKID